MDLADVMDELAQRLDTITELNCFAYPANNVQPPAALVLYPETITYDETYGRGTDSMALPVVVVVGRVSDASTKDALAAYCNGSGARSVKAVLESGTYTSFDLVRVGGMTAASWTISETEYMAAVFDLEITGDGA